MGTQVEIAREARRNHRGSHSVVSIAHDARNVMTALSVFSELLTEPGVLADSHRHYAQELRVLATAALGLMEQLLRPEGRNVGAAGEELLDWPPAAVDRALDRPCEVDG